MANVFSDLFLIKDRALTTIAPDAHLPLSTYLGEKLYAIINVDESGATAVDVNKILCRYPNIDLTRTYYDFFVNSCTLIMVEDCTVDLIPQRDVVSGKYLHRMVTLDPNAQEGWTVGFGNIDNPNTLNDLNQMGVLNDLFITPPSGTTLTNLLVSVNGVLHKTVPYQDSLYVIDGFSNVKQTGRNELLVCDTTGIGGHTVIPFTNLTLKSSDSDLPTQAIFTLPQNTPNKPVALVVEGYLKLFDASYSFPNTQTVVIDIPLLNITKSFLNNPLLRHKRDFFSVLNRPNPYNPETYTPVVTPNHTSVVTGETFDIFNTSPTVLKTVLESASFIKDRFNSPHSFLIQFNNPDVLVTEYSVSNTGEPHIYECYSTDTPRGLFLYGEGKTLAYTITSNRTDDQHFLYLGTIETTTEIYETGINDSYVPSGIADYQDLSIVKPAKLLEIFTANNNS